LSWHASKAKDSIIPRRGVARSFTRKKVTLDDPILTRWPAAQYPHRLQLFSVPTHNGLKVSIMLEERGLADEPHRIDITADESHAPAFLALNPNGKNLRSRRADRSRTHRACNSGRDASGRTRVYWSTHESNQNAIHLYDRVAERSRFVQYRKLLA
jgi:hypothetical protein